MDDLGISEIKAFVPARDFELSKKFYQDFGFDLKSSSDEIAYFCREHASFLLQNAFNEAHASNFMMHLLVRDVEAWWRHVGAQKIVEKYAVRAEPPADRPWGMRDFAIADPSGVVWRIGANLAR
ncbi:MAG: VOC family protein [Neomegalonema sp.]|nr:VOC family protein [Neomegalonema sp.]